jgi:hypothetical protein
MILHRLLVALFDNGVGFVTTSNFEPDGLYPGGLHRDRILPAIALLNQRMQVLSVDNGTDYRRRTLERVKLYHSPLGEQADAEMNDAFNRLATGPDEEPVLHIEARDISAKRRAGDVVWFDFRAICGGPRSQNDYLEIATQYHAVLLSNAKTDALAAFIEATGAARGTPTPITTNLAGLTFYPGLYESLTSIDFSAGGTLTLDAQGDPNAVFVIRSATAINALSTSQVVLSGGAKASNVFWSAGSAITLGTNSVMKGSLLASTAITLQTGAQLEGRALNQGAAAAAVTCDACTITVPSP